MDDRTIDRIDYRLMQSSGVIIYILGDNLTELLIGTALFIIGAVAAYITRDKENT